MYTFFKRVGETEDSMQMRACKGYGKAIVWKFRVKFLCYTVNGVSDLPGHRFEGTLLVAIDYYSLSLVTTL